MKFITYNEESRVFVLKTKQTVYQIQIGAHDTLLHLYYGADVGDMEICHRMPLVDRGFSGNPYEAGTDRTFSLDVLPQEYSGSGNGDYRVSGLEVLHKDGSNAVFLQYESHEMQEGKYSISGMPALFAKKEDAQTLKITLRDRVSGIKVELRYGVLFNQDVITRTVSITNEGKQDVQVQRAMSVQLDYPKQDMDFIHFYGRHNMERMTERHTLHHGIQSIESKRGTSSHHHNPFVILCDRDATETKGSCYGFALAYSGNHSCDVEVDQIDQIRLTMGIHPHHLSYCLTPGETFAAPEVIMAYSEGGLGSLSRIYHDVYRTNLIRSKYVDIPRPILVNNWEATYFDFDEEKLFQIAKTAKEIGLDMFVMDDGWFGKRDNDNSGLGDWVVNEGKLKGGLPQLVERVNGIGMKFGIWIEPEMISEDSDLYRAHPDWCLRIPGREATRSRYQLNLDVSRKEVRDYVMDQIFRVLDSCKIDYVKWDMNRSLDNVYSGGCSPKHQGEVYHRYVLGVYDMMERLVSRYPNLLFENCSGGGGRFDAGMLYYSPQIWCSDNTDAIERIKIQYGTSFGYPISSMGAHVSVCPNHQTGRTTPFETRGIVASAGTFGYELDLGKMTEDEKELARRQIQAYKEIEHLVQKGDYYRLTNPYKNQEYALWQFVAKDKKESIVHGVRLRNEANPRIHLIYPQGLKENAYYEEVGSGKRYTGSALMKAGIVLPSGAGDYQPIAFRFVEKE